MTTPQIALAKRFSSIEALGNIVENELLSGSTAFTIDQLVTLARTQQTIAKTLGMNRVKVEVDDQLEAYLARSMASAEDPDVVTYEELSSE